MPVHETAAPAKGPAPHKKDLLNVLIQYALMLGLGLSLLFMVVGAVLLPFHPVAASTHALFGRQVFNGLLDLNPLSFLSLGIILLMITPALRVLVAGIGYLIEKDMAFAAVSLGVFAILVLSVLVGAA